MRVLVSSSTFPLRPDDGLPRFVYDLAQALARRCQVTALAPDAPGAARRERMADVDVRRFSYFRPRRWQSLAYGHGILGNLRASPLAVLQPPPFVWCQARATRALVREQGIDLVNSHFLIPQGLSSALARGPSARFRHVLSVHAGDVYALSRLPFGRALARFVVSRCDGVFAAGSHVRERLDQLLRTPSQAVVQPMGADFALFRGAGARPPVASPFADGYVLFLGRFVEKKGAVYLLRALPRVLERWPGLGLIAIGYGPLEGDLRREVTRLGLEGSVEFVGRKTHAEIVPYLQGSRLAVVPSIIDRHGETEGMPTVVAEALAAGARVVGSAVDGIPDLIRHGRNGWLCRQRDPGDLAEKMLLALDDPTPSAIVERAVGTARGLDWAQVAGRYLEVFERLCVGESPE